MTQAKGTKLKASDLPEIYRELHSAFGHQDWWPGETPFEVMVGAILTQNTAWTNVELAIVNLKKAKVLTPRKMRLLSHKRLARLIRPAGYFNVKARRLRAFVDFLFAEYGGNLRRMFREDPQRLRVKLLAVNGIGPETADSILLYAGAMPSFVIDAYTKRIFSRHGLHAPEADYATWKALFEKALPKDTALYNDFHAQIVHLGKHHCKTRPVCQGCPLEKYL